MAVLTVAHELNLTIQMVEQMPRSIFFEWVAYFNIRNKGGEQ